MNGWYLEVSELEELTNSKDWESHNESVLKKNIIEWLNANIRHSQIWNVLQQGPEKGEKSNLNSHN